MRLICAKDVGSAIPVTIKEYEIRKIRCGGGGDA
jgi:hypothetical protein